MEKNNIEFSSIRITKALREAIRGAAELSEQSEEDFVHRWLAFMTWRIIQRNVEVVHLRGESVEEDFECLKYRWTRQKEGKRVLLCNYGTSEQFRVMAEAQSKMKEWLKDKGDIDVRVDDSFELFLKNIEYEGKWINLLKWEKDSELQGEGITLDERERLLTEEGRKYREERGYLESEIPFGAAPGIQGSALIPEILSESKEIFKLLESSEEIKLSLKDVLLLWFVIRLGKRGKRKVIKLVGKKRVKKF